MINQSSQPRKKSAWPALLFICVFAFLAIGTPKNVEASCSCFARIPVRATTASVNITSEFTAHQNWLVNDFYQDVILPTLHLMNEQLTATAIAQTTMVGAFFDAKHQLETQLVLDEIYVEAIQDYQPSVALCKLGTATKSLASSEHRAEINQSAFMKRSIDRHLGAQGTVAASASEDLDQRINQFANIYCNPDDNRGNLAGTADSFCGTSGGDPERYNKDINYTKTIDTPLTLDIDLTSNDSNTSTDPIEVGATPDEEDVFALATNLFGYELLSRPTIDKLKDNVEEYHAARSAIAKRSVAENSFYAIVTEKSGGTGASAEYLQQLVEQLGLPSGDAEELIGTSPSYYAQMEVLTKKMYQDPNFITSLIDKPANVERQKAAMQSFRLMQQRDFYNSLVRQEMVLSIILEELLYSRFNAIADNIEQ